jgi:hypothetical protein
MSILTLRHRRGPLVAGVLALAALLMLPSLQQVSSASAALEGLQAGEGLLQVTSSPAVATRITVGDIVRNTSSIAGLPLPAGQHRVCFTAPEDHLAPGCQLVEVREGALTSLVGAFEPAGMLSVTLEPAGIDAGIIVDGVARDRGAVLVPLAVGSHQVCAEPLPGYEPPVCREIVVDRGARADVVLTFDPLETPDEPAPLPDPEPEPEPEPGPSPEPVPAEPAVEVLLKPGERVTGGGPTWTASVVVSTRRSGTSVDGVVVGGVWGSGTSTSCVTAPDGTCSMSESGIHNRAKATTFTVTTVDDGPVDGPGVTVSR